MESMKSSHLSERFIEDRVLVINLEVQLEMSELLATLNKLQTCNGAKIWASPTKAI